MNTITLETPFGAVSIHFHSDTTCTANLRQEPKLVINTVTVEGLLQFQRRSQTWEWQQDKSNLNRQDNGRAVSEAVRNKLTTTLTALLNEWYKANPEAFQTVKVALIQQEITNERYELKQLLSRIKKQQKVVSNLKKALLLAQHEQLLLAQHEQPKTGTPQP